MTDPRHTRRWRRLVAYVIQRDHGICWRCGHTGADQGGHILPVITHPHLAFDPDNVRAEHGRRRTIERDGYDCEGNHAAGARIRSGSALHIARRRWLERASGAVLAWWRPPTATPAAENLSLRVRYGFLGSGR